MVGRRQKAGEKLFSEGEVNEERSKQLGKDWVEGGCVLCTLG
jgi:hypothetical protein